MPIEDRNIYLSTSTPTPTPTPTTPTPTSTTAPSGSDEHLTALLRGLYRKHVVHENLEDEDDEEEEEEADDTGRGCAASLPPRVCVVLDRVTTVP